MLDWFKEKNYIDKVKIPAKENLIFIRKVAWSATHDKNHFGIRKIKLLMEKFSNYKILISDERLSSRKIKAENYHRILGKAKLVISEGASTAIESALLGTPTIYINSLRPEQIKRLNKLKLLTILNNDEDIIINYEKIIYESEKSKESLKKLKKNSTDINTLIAEEIELMVE
mgnify:CR=1 FL=1